ncbi:MAG: hypothetical protein LUC41_02255 [Clostridiales bacterium]|nr:hypothetical protein [Clostridiales bacterium]
MPASQIETRTRFKRQYLEFDGRSSKDYLLFLSGPGVYNSPAPDTETVNVPGMNGSIIRENAAPGMRRFSNVDIKYKAFFFNGLPAKTQAVKSWLLSPAGYRKLKDTYAPGFFRMAVCTQALSFDVTRQKAAQMELVFNCKPQRWSEEGQNPITLSEPGMTLMNPFDFYSQPVIKVSGDGGGTITIGDRSVAIYSFDGDVTLNCETQNAYLADGTFCNNAIYSEEFPLLAPGVNGIDWDGGITAVEIIPRWWTL